MATIPLPPDFSEFLRLLNAHEVRYLLVGGYAVGYYGYVRATADMDDWDDVSVNVISLPKLKDNKRASGRLKDLNDLEHLE